MKPEEMLARALLKSSRTPLVVVFCPAERHRHKLGAVYEMPADSPPVLCAHGFEIRTEDFYEGRPPSIVPARFATWAYPLGGTQTVLSRCRHGTYSIYRASLRDDVARANTTGETQYTFGSWTGRPGWPD